MARFVRGELTGAGARRRPVPPVQVARISASYASAYLAQVLGLPARRPAVRKEIPNRFVRPAARVFLAPSAAVAASLLVGSVLGMSFKAGNKHPFPGAVRSGGGD